MVFIDYNIVFDAANLTTSVSSGVPSRVIDNHGVVNKKSSAKRSDNSSSDVANTESSAKGSDLSSKLLPKGKNNSKDGSNISSIDKKKPQGISGNLSSDVYLNVKSEYPKHSSAEKAISDVQYKPEKWMIPDQKNDVLTQLNLAIVSHLSDFS